MSGRISDIRARNVLGERLATVRYCRKCDFYVPQGTDCPLCGGKVNTKISTVVWKKMIAEKIGVSLLFFAVVLLSDWLLLGRISLASPLMIIADIFFVLQIVTAAVGYRGLYIKYLVRFLTKHDRMIKNSFATEKLVEKYDVTGIYYNGKKQNKAIEIHGSNAFEAYHELRKISAALDSPKCKALRAHALMQLDWDTVGLYEADSLCPREYNGTVVRYLHRLLATNANYITSNSVRYILCFADEIRAALPEGAEIVAAFAEHAGNTFPDLQETNLQETKRDLLVGEKVKW